MSEQRRESRQRVFLKGRITFNNGASSMDCLLRDMSAKGARLSVSETTTLPDVFELHVPQKGKSFRARLRWRKEDGVGVHLGDEAGAAEPAKPDDGVEASLTVLLRRVSELEAENAALRRLLSESTRQPGAQASAA